MTANPLARRSGKAETSTTASLRDICAERNARSAVLSRWYWVRTVKRQGIDDAREMAILQGLEAEEVHKLRNGVFPTYVHWDADKLREHTRRLIAILKRGLSESEFERWKAANRK